MVLKKLAVNVMALLSASTAARFISFVTLAIIARQIGPTAFGQYSASIALVTIIFTFASLGLDGWVLYKGGASSFELDKLFASAFFLKFVIGIGGLIIARILSFWLNPVSFPWILLLLGSFTLWLESFARLTWTVFKATLHNEFTLLLMLTLQLTFLIITLFLAWQNVRVPEGYLMARFLSAFITAALSLIFATRWFGFHLDRDMIFTTLKGAMPFAASVTLATIYGRADLTIVANELGQRAAGIYGPAIALTSALSLVPLSLFEVAVPYLSKVYKKDPRRIPRLVQPLISSAVLIGLVLGLTLRSFAYPLIKLIYGEAFRASGDVLGILGAVLALRCPNVVLAAFLIAVGKQMYRVYAQTLSAGLNVLLNIVLARYVGVLGVAKIYVFTEFILFAGYLGGFLIWLRRGRVG